MTASYMSTEDPKEPAQTVRLVQLPGQVPSSPDSVPVEELIGDQETLLNGHSNLFVPATADPDQQVITLHTSNGTFQQVEHNGEANSDGADESANHTQSWQVFSHAISVKTGFPGSESGSQQNGYHDEVSFDALELEAVTLKLPVVKGQALAQPATDDLETRPQVNGHNAEVSLDGLKLEEETLKLPVVKGQALAQPATDDLTVVIPTRNERDNILPLLHALQAALEGMKVEIIFVDDSDDDTPLLIKEASGALETSMFHVQVEHRQPGIAREGGLATAIVHG